jgi:hypothetical protein
VEISPCGGMNNKWLSSGRGGQRGWVS